jgi:hypothetical protein
VGINGERARVLITVKASPQPSAKYGDTVCVAGLRIDVEPHTWVRLYPVPFRWLESSSQFSKYDVIDLQMNRRRQDSRSESYVPDTQSIEVVQHLDDWSDRGPYMNTLSTTTTCRLMRDAERDHAAPSLGMVHVKKLLGFELEDHPGWTPSEEAKIAQAMMTSELDLFGTNAQPARLRSPRLKLRYRYLCEEAGCLGHQGLNLDWELTALQNRHRGEPISRLREIVEDRFVRMMFEERRLTSFFMGNFEAAIKRSKFSVLGTYYPPRGVASEVPLF